MSHHTYHNHQPHTDVSSEWNEHTEDCHYQERDAQHPATPNPLYQQVTTYQVHGLEGCMQVLREKK